METKIKSSDIDDYLSKYHTETSKDYSQLKNGDIVRYNHTYYVLKEQSNSLNKFDLYTLDNELYKESVNLQELEFVLTEETYNNLYNVVKEKNSATSSEFNKYINDSVDITYNKTRTTKNYSVYNKTNINDIKDKNKTSELDQNLGSEDQTKRTVNDCQQMIDKANEAIRTNNITINKWEDAHNASGYATQASIVFLNNLSNALTTLQSNLNTTKEAAEDVNELNENVKKLLVEFVEKEKKEEIKEEKENQLKEMSPTITVKNEDNTTSEVENKEYTILSEEIEELNKELIIIDKKIESLQILIDNKYIVIQKNYNNLINLSNYGITTSGNNIFSKGSTGEELDSMQYANSKDIKIDYIEFVSSEGKKVQTFIFVPKNTEGKKLPTMLYMHGDAAGGQNPNTALKQGLPKLIKDGELELEGILIVPYVTAAYRDETERAMKELCDKVVESYNVDTDRFSISGHSSGAMMGYKLVSDYPNYYSCFIPVSGSLPHKVNDSFKNIKVWSFNSVKEDDDSSTPYSHGVSTVKKINEIGGNATLTTLRNIHRYTNDEAYSKTYMSPDGIEENPLEWALRQTRKSTSAA